MSNEFQSYVHNGQVKVGLLGCVWHRSTMYYMSIVGASISVKSIWATAVAKKTLNTRPWGYSGMKFEGKILHASSKLPETTLSHSIIWDRQEESLIMLHDHRGMQHIQAVYRDYKTREEHNQQRKGWVMERKADLVAQMMSILYTKTAIPVLDSWGPTLWEEAGRRMLVEEMNCGGDIIASVRVRLDRADDWSKMVSDLLKRGKISL